MSDKPHDGHPSEADLIASREGRLAHSEHEKLQNHLSKCRECLRMYRDLADFFDPAREGEQKLGEVGVRQAWNAFRQKLQQEDTGNVRTSAAGAVRDIRPKDSSVGARIVRFFEFRLPVKPAVSLAATLLLALGLTGTWALWLNRDRQQLAERLTAANNQATARLEEERRQWQAQTENLKKQYESQLAVVREPQLNASVYDVFPAGAVQRSGKTDFNQLVIPADTNGFTLILNGEGVPKHPQYSVEILGQGDRVLWQGKGLQPDRFGNFFIRVPSSFLASGRYRLRLYGANAGSAPAAEYHIAIQLTPH